jgi:hypothetical protein
MKNERASEEKLIRELDSLYQRVADIEGGESTDPKIIPFPIQRTQVPSGETQEDDQEFGRRPSYRFHFIVASLSVIFLSLLLIMIIAKVFIAPRGSEIGDTHPSTFPIHSLSSPPVQKEQEAGQNIEERAEKTESISNETMKPGTSLVQKSHYVIQIGAFHNLEYARDLTEGLEKKGLDAYWTATDRKGGGTLYRVFSRRFVDRNEAVKYMADNKISNDYPDSFVREISVSKGNP